ncbi:MAG: Gfo/Idh/MocA family oxidoreductase [Phycisphaerales bacterium]|nr:MAG: Gfo/Idh/MocA family oxidoreductase [Phycisphaerales bacterium]
MNPLRITRRSFLKATAATAAAGPFVRAHTARAQDAGEKLNIAVVGTQNQAWWNITQIADENIVALCDVDANYLARAGEQFPGAARYRDFRIMLEKEEKKIDAVLVAAPDHIHAPASVMAMRLGKHVYCEKPLAHSVWETRLMAKLAREKNLATQLGTQIHAGGNYRRVVELIQSGAIGPVRQVHVWCNKSWSNGRYKFGSSAPAHLDWDLWLGPSAKRPYSEGVHPANWRRYWDWGTGTLGDMACHHMDLAHWALDLRHPTNVRALGPAVHEVGTPDGMIVHYEHPARGDKPPVNVTWYDGPNRPSILQALRTKDGAPLQWGDGQIFVGDEGMLIADYGRHLLLPEEKFADYARPEPYIPDSIGHHAEWIVACKTGSATTCNFDYSGALTETVLLGNVAFRVGRALQWDAANLKVTNAPEADQYIRPEFRQGWEL